MARISYVSTENFYIEKYTLKKPQANMHYHHSYELYYLIEGEREYFIGDMFFKIQKGDFVYVPGNMIHRTGGKGATRVLLYFKPDFVGKYMRRPMLDRLLPKEPFVFRATQTDDKQLNLLLNRIMAEYAKSERADGEADEMLLAGYLFELLFLVNTAENNYIPHSSEDNRISKIIRYINENYAHISGMEEVADKFFISKYYLCRIFKESIGVSFVSYLNTIRIKAACEMLKSTDSYLSDIAISCGFNSTPYFCKVFKDEKGVSHSEYRRRAK